MLTRRRFLQSSLVALAPTVPLFVARSVRGAPAAKDGRVLVVVQLDGGNDALNTVVPHTNPDYEKLRPTLKIAAKNLVPLTDSLGLHPSLKPLDKLLQSKQLAVIPGVGYPNPNRSHFQSMAIWHTAQFDKEALRSYGWLGRALDPSAGTSYMVGGAVPTALRGRRSATVSLNSIDELLLANNAAARQAVGAETTDDLLAYVRRQEVDALTAADTLAAAKGSDGGGYPGGGLGDRLRLIARLLKSDLGARVFYTSQAGYDTHTNQRFAHSGLLAEFAGAVAAFFEDLKSAKLAERVVLLAFSEFARTIKENGSAGTDHGTAGVVFLAGPAVKGGLAGSMPSLTDLAGGEPKMTTDFRHVYATTLTWLGLPTEGLGNTMEVLPLFQA